MRSARILVVGVPVCEVLHEEMRSLESSQPEHRFGDCLNDGVSHQVIRNSTACFHEHVATRLHAHFGSNVVIHPNVVDGGLVRVALQGVAQMFLPRPNAPSLNIRRPPCRCESDVEGHLENRSGCFLGRTPASGASRHLNAPHYCSLLLVVNGCCFVRLAVSVRPLENCARLAVLGNNKSTRRVVLPTSLFNFEGCRIRI